jgi:pimeloyl-ACP methyl ester carboxylesterase
VFYTRIIVLGCLLGWVGCANKELGPDKIPKDCELPSWLSPITGVACTPLPQSLPKKARVEAGLWPERRNVQFYRLVQPDAKFEFIFVHGALGRAADFRKIFVDPLPEANLLAYDRPGYGRSNDNELTGELNSQVELLASVVRSRRLPVILVGHSYGGAIALKTAVDFPEGIAGVVLIGAILDPAEASPFLIQFPLDTAWGLLPKPVRATNREIIHLAEGLEQLKSKLNRLKIPIVALQGTRDPIVNESNTVYLYDQLRRAGHEKILEVRLLKGLNHFIPDQHPEVVQSALRAIEDKINIP